MACRFGPSHNSDYRSMPSGRPECRFKLGSNVACRAIEGSAVGSEILMYRCLQVLIVCSQPEGLPRVGSEVVERVFHYVADHTWGPVYARGLSANMDIYNF